MQRRLRARRSVAKQLRRRPRRLAKYAGVSARGGGGLLWQVHESCDAPSLGGFVMPRVVACCGACCCVCGGEVARCRCGHAVSAIVSLWFGDGKWVIADGVVWRCCSRCWRLSCWGQVGLVGWVVRLHYDSPIHFLKEAEFSWLMMISSFTGRVSSTLILLLSSGLKRLI